MWNDLATADWGALGPIFAIIGMVFFLLAGKFIDRRNKKDEIIYQRDRDYSVRQSEEIQRLIDQHNHCAEELVRLQTEMAGLHRDLAIKDTEIILIQSQLEECKEKLDQ